MEEWADIDAYYRISSEGRVYSKLNKTILKQSKDGWGYPVISLMGKTFKIHTLVAKAFCDKPESATQVNHKNGNKQDNCYLNLEWCTGSQNIQHAYDTGLMPRGENKPLAELKEVQVAQIKLLMMQGKNDHELAKEFNVHNGTVNAIRNLKNWKHVHPELALPISQGVVGARKGDDRSVKLEPKDIPQIRDASRHGYTVSHISKVFGVAPRTIQSILSGKSWKNY